MSRKINYEILNGFITMIIVDVVQKYVFKLKKERKKPPKLIENYLDESVLLIKEHQANIKISKMKDTIVDIDEKQQKEFNKLFEKYKDYELLCKELNFAYLLIIDKELQIKTLTLLYDNIYQYNILINQDLITKKQIKIDRVIKESNEEKLDKLHFYKNNSKNYSGTLFKVN